MRPVVVEITVDLDAEPELVWRLLTDWERQGDWMREASDFVVVSAHREGKGVEAEATVKIGGVSTRDRIKVDVWEPHRHLGILHLGWVEGRGDLLLEPLSGQPAQRTRLHWREELHPPWGPLGWAGMQAFRPLLARTFRRDARILSQLVLEARAGRYPGETS